MIQKLVKSFDVFDTLMGRICGEPDEIFNDIAAVTKYPNFQHLRKLSESKSDGSWESIWEQFRKLTSLSQSETTTLKNMEWDLEKTYSFPILMNVSCLNSIDILVSDMYLSHGMISELLNNNNIKNYEKLYVSSNGKRSGSIWNIISREGYKVILHTGDNMECDVLSPQKYKIKTSFFNKNYSNKEKFFLQNQNKNIANLLRITRLSNKYLVDSNIAMQWDILSNIYPIYKIIFSSYQKNYYSNYFIDKYNKYLNNFDTDLIDKTMLVSMGEIAQEYILKLNIDIDKISSQREIISQYLKFNCQV